MVVLGDASRDESFVLQSICDRLNNIPYHILSHVPYLISPRHLGSGNGMGGLLIDKIFDPLEVVITDMESHMDHIRHNILLNPGVSREEQS